MDFYLKLEHMFMFAISENYDGVVFFIHRRSCMRMVLNQVIFFSIIKITQLSVLLFQLISLRHIDQ